MNITNCSNCGAVNQPDNKTCVACGKPMSKECPECKTINSFSAAFCSKCNLSLYQADFNPISIEEPFGKEIPPDLPPEEPVATPFPKSALLRFVIALFVFGSIYFSAILSANPVLLFAVSVASGIVALWGLLDLTFWYVYHNDKKEKPTTTEPLPENFTAASLDGLSAMTEGFEEEDKKIALPQTPPEIEATIDNFNISSSFIDSSKVTTSPATDNQYKNFSLYLNDEIDQEITAASNSLKSNPENFALAFTLSQLYEEKGQLDEALKTVEQCIKIQPDTPEVYLYHGVLLKYKGFYDQALISLNRALELNPNMAKTFYHLGTLEKIRGNLLQARDYLRQCIQLTPDDAYAHYQLGMIYLNTNETNLAILELKRATTLHPTDSYGHSKLGQIYQKAKQYNKAIYSYSQALNIKPDDAFVLEKLAETTFEKGDYPRSLELYYDTISKQSTPKLPTLVCLARVLLKLEEYNQLSRVVSDILAKQPNNQEAIYYKAIVEIKNHNPYKAISILEELTKQPNLSHEPWLELAKLYQTQNENKKAISALTRAATNAPDQASIWNSIGILLSKEKRITEAYSAFRKAASFDYTNQQIVNNLKTFQKKVEQTYQKIIKEKIYKIKKNPKNLKTYLQLANAYEVLEQPQNAISTYKSLLEIQSDFLPGLKAYADILKKQGKLRLAMRCYQEILKQDPDNPEAHISLIQANLNLGFLNVALRYAVNAQILKIEDPRLRFLLGKLYFAKGINSRALKEYSYVAENSDSPDLVSWAELMRRRLSNAEE